MKEVKPTVFVVDDDAAVRDSLRMLLKSVGLPVEVFESGQEFLDADRDDRPPLWRYLNPPASGEAATTSVVAGKLSDFKPNSGAVIKFGSRPAIVVRAPDGQFRAFNAVCTHLDCTVQYKADTSQSWCACHNGMYDLGGNVVSGPPPRPLEAFMVKLRGEPGQEEVVVSRG